MTSLHLLVADLRHAELCVLGCKFVVRPSQVMLTWSIYRAFSSFLLHSSLPNSAHCCYHPDYPLIQSP